MPELRRDPITRRWAIIATDRALRPQDFQTHAKEPEQAHRCPFCEGNEHLTPDEIAALRPDGSAPNTPGWQIRVVPNKYPALRIEGGLDRRPEGIYDQMNGVGAHEIIIEAPEAEFRLHHLPHDHLVNVLCMYRDRMNDLQGDDRFKFCLLFRNFGRAAGATVRHGHAQLIALPVVPSETETLLDGAKKYYEFHERNAFEDIIRQELADGRRLVFENRGFVVVAPYASRVPFELCIIPRYQATRFETESREHLSDLADALRTALDRLDRGLGSPAYNFVIQTAPYGLDDAPWYRWHIQIMPKLTRVAGFELGTGFYINPTAPEEAAEFLRGLPG